MIIEQEENICLFCLEVTKGRRLHLPIEFKGLFPCECVFQSHAECIIKWQIHCLDEIQCPICRTHLIVPEEEIRMDAIIVYQPIHRIDAIAKKYLLFLSVNIVFVFLFFVFSISLFQA